MVLKRPQKVGIFLCNRVTSHTSGADRRLVKGLQSNMEKADVGLLPGKVKLGKPELLGVLPGTGHCVITSW